jgi:hypothetical protein
MDETRNAWKEHLALIGENAFQSAYSKPYDPELLSALLSAVAAMISENDEAHSR